MKELKYILRNLYKYPIHITHGDHYHLYKILTSREELSSGPVTLTASNGKEYLVNLKAFASWIQDGDVIVDDGHDVVALYLEENMK
ncbi:hypothetical protein [Ureaplasma canigenitalium]|uniref:hypothetical protein n=1 Tax=Ureaplasma canigenitalium TaxID=42092 RepID=UPI0004E0E0DA|nr:hypothetical protein [Ureaplasma canigenitalium]